MRIQHRYLTWDSHPDILNPVKRFLDKYAIDYIYKEDLQGVVQSHKYALEFSLYEDNPLFSELKQEANQYKENFLYQVGTIYEKADIENANWFIVNVGQHQYPQPENVYGISNATFILDNYCKFCGIGKVQNGPYRLKTEPGQLNKQFWGIHWALDAIFVRQETRSILEKENIKGIRFSKPVLHKSNIEIDSIFQLHIDSILENGFDSYNTKTITCKHNNEENYHTDPDRKCCGRIKFHHPMTGGYTFDENIFNADFDFVQTNEYFGSGGSANRLQIVSKRIKKIIDINKLKGIYFTPIFHRQFNH